MVKFTPSAAEVALVNQIFSQVDSQKLGVITGDAAVKVFGGAKLSPTVLAEIWNIADDENNGVLTRKGVAVAVRLLGHAQRGELISEDLVNQPGSVPIIEGLNTPLAQQLTGTISSKSPSPSYPPLTAQDRAKFLKLFQGCEPIGGLLSGDKARDVLVRSKLPVEKLSQIWNLADSKKRGALDLTDFIVAMYFVQGSMSGQLQTLPSTLPSSIYDQASGKGSREGVLSHSTGDSGTLGQSGFGSFSGRPVSTIQPQYTGQNLGLQPQLTGQAFRTAARSPPLPARSSVASSPPPFNVPSPSVQWDVTPAEKARSDALFDSRDTQKNGYIEADVAVPLFVQSKLPDDILAQVWDLSDLNNDGRLTRDGFAVAMHLIYGKLAGREIPSTLPSSLVPPSMRATSPAPPAQPYVPEAMRDLLWDDTPPPSATLPQSPPAIQPPVARAVSPQHTASFVQPPRATIYGSPDPFGSSTFAPPTSPQRDLLGDDDEPAHSSPPLQDKSAEIGNTQNQLNSTNQSLDRAQAERANLERILSDQATQLAGLQAQLAAAKASYERETEILTNLKTRHSTQSADIQRTREELIHAESDLSAIRVEKAEIEGAVLRDKEEVRELQRKMTEVGSHTEMTKSEVEKAKKEAKQQKGLLAIAKKQLATREAERAKEEKRLEEPGPKPKQRRKKEKRQKPNWRKNSSLRKSMGRSPEVSTPGVSPTTKSNNPFERLARASSLSERADSPFLPFATSVLPTPPTAPAHDVVAPTSDADASLFEDPFGFSAFAPTASGTTETYPTIDDGASEEVGEHGPPPGLGVPSETVMSPTETEMFMTPPSSAVPVLSPPTKKDTDLVEAAAAQFPDLDAPSGQPTEPSSRVPGHFPTDAEEHTHLDSQLKELEVDESDSEDDDDDEPLTSVKAKLAESHAAPAAPVETPSTSAFDDSFGIATTSVAKETPVAAKPASENGSATGSASATGKELFVASLPTPNQTVPVTDSKQNGTATVSDAPAGVSDFDEALGKIPGTTGAPVQFTDFSFETAFDDNFDFAAASAASKDTEPSPIVPNGNVANTFPAAPSANPSATSDTFDAVFLSSNSGSSPAPPVLLPNATSPSVTGPVPGPTAPEAKPFSFDDAFGSPTVQQTSQPTIQPPAHSGTPKALAQVTMPTPQLNLPPTAKTTQTNGSTGISFDDAFGGVSPSEALALGSNIPATTYDPPPGPPPQQSTSALSQQSHSLLHHGTPITWDRN
ncbi:hypothetical protein NLI96_g7540 [Meripilus lineatus]|uniref:Actin cytoskeleton-regulatory complex protein PAN1 n=1 Tax=Meripilus lineatus TaxID=2056292 RepID=A0AAD5YCV3_9APHY|nr:hypothetical protein NLI96_g7540 [Physisporinus lineatus]